MLAAMLGKERFIWADTERPLGEQKSSTVFENRLSHLGSAVDMCRRPWVKVVLGLKSLLQISKMMTMIDVAMMKNGNGGDDDL